MTEPLRLRMLRLEKLLAAARRVADANDELGRRFRKRLAETTLLTPEGVELAIERCLETNPSRGELRALCDAVAPAPRARLLLSANVFTGAHRAIAVALAASADVSVRASRRDPALTELLHEATGGLFRLTNELRPQPGDHLWAYGREVTLNELRAGLPGGVVLHAHGPGVGLAVVQPRHDTRSEPGRDVTAPARALAEDVGLFDQRGCLSPRIALIVGPPNVAEAFCRELVRSLAELERRVPRGALDPDEAADIARYRDALTYAARVMPAGKGFVSLDVEGRLLLVPPVGRNVHVTCVTAPEPALRELGPAVTAVGTAGPPTLAERVLTVLPQARISPLGTMQRPPFDGPVDRRVPPRGELI